MDKNFEKNNLIKNDTENLLNKLRDKISEKYWIEKQKAEFLIKKESFTSIQDLKEELQNNKNFLENSKLEELLNDLNNVKEILKNSSKNEISKLNSEIKNSLENKNDSTFIEKYFSENFLKTAKNPEKPHEHLIWASLWIANSSLVLGESIWKIWIWILKSPYDLYLLVSGKAELENIKKV